MFDVATTIVPVVGTTFSPLGVGDCWSRRRMPTKATMARKTPTNKTKRLERFKLVLPEKV
jgi:hypothetical protein